nr:hypothetical protein [Tanacetum cinerariifolium]
MSALNQQTLAESGANDIPLILGKENYIPWETSKAKKVAKNNYPLALIAHSNAYSSQSHARSSYSHSPQPYYVTQPSSVVDSEEDYQRELQRDAQEDKLTTAMIVDIQTKNASYGGNGNRNDGRQNRNQVANVGNGLVQQIDESNQIVQRIPRTESNPGRAEVQCYYARGYYAHDCPKPTVHDAKYFREQMLLAMKDEAEGTLNDEENDFMLDNAYEDETLEESTAAVIMMARIQPACDNAESEPKYDVEAVSEVNASHINLISSMISKGVHEHTNHENLTTVINTSDDDQIDCNIIFDDPYVEIMVD